MKLFTDQCCSNLLHFVANEKLRSNYFLEAFDSTLFEYLKYEVEGITPGSLKLDPSPASDGENSIKVFETLKELSLTQANDRRLWVMLTHTEFFDYTRERWAITDSDSDEKIIRRFHFEGYSIEARMRNSISRLWFAAKLTYDKSRDDPYELTKLLWSKQDLYQNLLERSYGSYENLLKGFLEFYNENKGLKEDQLRQLFTALNSIGGVRVLSIHDKTEIKDMLVRLKAYYRMDENIIST